jgi:hypothetical protein
VALSYVRADPPVDGDGTSEWQGGAAQVDEEWATKNKDDYVATANVDGKVEEFTIAVGIGAGASGTMEYLAYFLYYDAIPNPDVPYLELRVLVNGVQQGETKELQTNGLDQEKTVLWTSSDGTPFSVDCATWRTGPRIMRMTYRSTGGGAKPEGELVGFMVND